MTRDLATPLAPTFGAGWPRKPKKRLKRSGKHKRRRGGMKTQLTKTVTFRKCKGGFCTR